MSRILLVANYPSDEGYAWWLMENFWVRIAEWAARQGRECVLAYPRITTLPPAIAASSIKTVELAFDVRSRAGRAALRRLFRDEDITSVYLTDFALLSVHFAWLRAHGIRRIVVHDHTPGDRRPAAGLSKWGKSLAHALGLFSATRYIAVSDFVRDRIISSWRVRPSRCVTVQNGIPTGRGSPARRDGLRRDLGIPESHRLVISVSRAYTYKGLDLMLEVADRLRARGVDDVTILHCGDGPDLASYREQARARGLDSRFILAGHRTDARDLMHAADIAIHPSRGEAHCLAILEYMDAGLPVVVPDTRSVSQDVTDGVNGLVFPAEDADAAASAVMRLAGDEALRARLGEHGRQLVRSRFTLEAVNARFLAAIEGQL